MKKILVVLVCLGMLTTYACSQETNNLVEIKGVLKQDFSSWTPHFNRCTSEDWSIRYNDKTYYLANVCSFGLSAFRKMSKKEVIVKGRLEEREVDVPLRKAPNPPTEKKIYTVINVQKIKVIK